MTHIPIAKKVPQGIWLFLRILAGLSLLYFAWLILDLVTHPFNPGNNLPSIPYLFRWLSAASGAFTVVVAVFIMYRVPDNINGLLLLFWGVGAAGWSLRSDFGSPLVTGLVRGLFLFYFICFSFPALDALIFQFPTGQAFPPRFAGWIWRLLLFVSGFAGVIFIFGSPSSDPASPNPVYIPALSVFEPVLSILIIIILPVLALISLGLRFRAAGLIERLQIKWLLWLAGVGVAVTIVTTVFSSVSINGGPDSLANQITKVVGYIYWQAYPAVAIGIALLRHRLWDIDLIIRRTLQYSLVTGVLVLVYIGGITLMQALFTNLTGQLSSLAIALSTLAIAALFNPLRRWVQEFIDRRFYRRKYDAEQALAEFALTARSETDLGQLTSKMIGAVQDTLQPEKISLWLCPSAEPTVRKGP